MTTLLIDATPVKTDAKGVGRYAYHVCLQLAERLPADWMLWIIVHPEAQNLFPPGFRGKLLPVEQRPELVHGIFTLRKCVKRVRPDVLLKTVESTGQAPVATVTICHDIDDLILAAQTFPRPVLRRAIDRWKTYLRKRALQESKFVFCNSAFTRNAVESYYKISPAKTKVAYCAVDPRFYEKSRLVDKKKILQKYGVENLVLTFATGDTRENFKLLPQVAQTIRDSGLPTCLLIAGVKADSLYVREMRDSFHKLGLIEGEHFILESFLGAERFSDLVDLYTAADFYLELSLHEGFGMQLVEAMACGTTCITSPNGALAEVSCGYTIFIDPTSVHSVAAGLLTSYKMNLHLRDNREQVSYTHKFSWDAMGETIAAVLMKLPDEKPVL